MKKAARARSPAPNPDAPVIAGVHRDGEALQIEFPFAVPTPAAVFRRADTLWLVFDNPAKISLGKLAAESGGAIHGATVKRSKDGAAVVRIRLRRPRLISVDSDGPAWMVTIADTVTTPSTPLSIARSMVARNRANIVVPFDNPGKLHRLRDPEVGDRLLVMTGLAPVRGFLRAQDFVELDALASRQGVVVRPIADDVDRKSRPRQCHLQPSRWPGAVAGAGPAATIGGQLPRHHLRHPALDSRSQRRLLPAAVGVDPAGRRGGAAPAPRGAAQSCALLSRPRHVGRGQGRARRSLHRRPRRRDRQRAQVGRQYHARPAEGRAQGSFAAAGRQPA